MNPKRLLLLLLALCMLPLSAMAEEVLALGEDITGTYVYPEGASEADARYIYRFTYPQIAGDSDVALLINTTYQYQASDALGFECPMIASSLPETDPQMVITITYEVTHLSADYLSVAIRKEVASGELVTVILSGHVFPLTGAEPGAVTSLPYLLGILDPAETDEWYLDRQIAKADNCARELVWAMIQPEMAAADSIYYGDLTYEEFADCFYPEEDFYLNAEGDVVFFLQEGVAAPAEFGPLTYTIPLETILDEI